MYSRDNSNDSFLSCKIVALIIFILIWIIAIYLIQIDKKERNAGEPCPKNISSKKSIKVRPQFQIKF